MILPLLTIACATAPLPELSVTLGVDVYDEPPDATVTP